jgi:DNA polymerase elongation subunit (family B)
MVVFQALTWESRDTDDEHMISIFGKTEDGKSVCLTTAFTPYFFVKLPENINTPKIRRIYEIIDQQCKDSLVAYTVVKSKDVWGFQNNQEFPFMKISFKHLQARRLVDSFLRKPLDRTPELFDIFGVRNVKVYESNLDPVLRLMHRTGIQSTGWLDTGDKCIRSHLANVDMDLFSNDWTTLKPVARDDIAPFVVASVDIECYSKSRKFPDANNTDDVCFQIAISLCKFGSDEPYDKTCLCYKKTDSNLEGCNILSYPTEKEMLEAFQKYLHQKDVDIITGWNIFGFDMEYIYKRAQINRCHYDFFNLGKLKDTESELTIKKLSSSALGDNLLKLLPMSGRFIFDLFHEIKKGYKLDSYKLDNVSKLYLGDQKIDMTPKEMFFRYEEEDPVKLREVAEYCIKDTLLPHRLMKKLCTLLNLVEMAKATWVPVPFLVERGQQIKVFSQLTKKARELGFMVPTIRYGAIPEEPYEGATVLEAQKGAYYTPITALDFESLYPSIMMAHNLCYSSYVMDEKRYGNVPGITYETFKIADRTYKFAQDVPSLLPAILLELKQFRKQAKKDMAAATGFMKEVYNGKQLAYKISMNSVYGFTGAGKGILPCVPIASTTTSKGRAMIEETKNYVEKHFPGSKVRYGDSVTPDTPLLIRQNGEVKTTRIDSLVDVYELRDDGKEIAEIDAEVWTESGFTPIQQIVRHKTTKNIHRVLTHTGVVDVTEDHSLLLKNKEMIKPSEVCLGTELLHGNSVEAFGESDTSVTPEEAKVMGFFFGDGSCGHYDGKYTWALNNSNMKYLEEMKSLCPFETRVYDTIESSGVYKLNAVGDVKSISTKYRSLFYNQHKEKVVPPCILGAPLSVVKSFWEGYYMADGDKDVHGYTRMDIKGKEGSMGMYIIGRRLGYNVSVNTRSDKPDVFRQTWTTSSQRKNPIAIKKLELVGETNGYVYDLTTGSHHFHVGPGELVVHNTDSVMVEFDVGDRKGEEAIAYSWEVGERAAEECSALFKKPNNLELEKVYWPYFLYSKKRYAAKLWTKGKDDKMHMDYIDVKGLQLVRRDNTPHVREVCKELLDVVLTSSDPGPPKELAKERAIELLSGDVPNEKLVLSQSLADTYKVAGKNVSVTSSESVNINQSHVQVVTKMRQRKPGSEPQSGDRVPYLLTKTENAKAKAYEKAEDPKYVEEHGVPVDYHYYFLNKFLNPVCDLLDPLYENVKEEIFGEIINQHKPPKPKREPALSTMKKDDLIAECKRRGLEETGTLVVLRARLKEARQGSVEDIFKNYELKQSKDESSREDYADS